MKNELLIKSALSNFELIMDNMDEDSRDDLILLITTLFKRYQKPGTPTYTPLNIVFEDGKDRNVYDDKNSPPVAVVHGYELTAEQWKIYELLSPGKQMNKQRLLYLLDVFNENLWQ